jgi:hypothetical protein
VHSVPEPVPAYRVAEAKPSGWPLMGAVPNEDRGSKLDLRSGDLVLRIIGSPHWVRKCRFDAIDHLLDDLIATAALAGEHRPHLPERDEQELLDLPCSLRCSRRASSVSLCKIDAPTKQAQLGMKRSGHNTGS